jgi:hypothetical protein
MELNLRTTDNAARALTGDELDAVCGGMINPPSPKPIEIVLGPITISIGSGGITIHPSR